MIFNSSIDVKMWTSAGDSECGSEFRDCDMNDGMQHRKMRKVDSFLNLSIVAVEENCVETLSSLKRDESILSGFEVKNLASIVVNMMVGGKVPFSSLPRKKLSAHVKQDMSGGNFGLTSDLGFDTSADTFQLDPQIHLISGNDTRKFCDIFNHQRYTLSVNQGATDDDPDCEPPSVFEVGCRVQLRKDRSKEGVIVEEKAGGWRVVSFLDGTQARFRPSDLIRSVRKGSNSRGSLRPTGNELAKRWASHQPQRSVDSTKIGESLKLSAQTNGENRMNAASTQQIISASSVSLHSHTANLQPQIKVLESAQPTVPIQQTPAAALVQSSRSASAEILESISPPTLVIGSFVRVRKTGQLGTVVADKPGGWRVVKFSDGSGQSMFRPSDVLLAARPGTGTSGAPGVRSTNRPAGLLPGSSAKNWRSSSSRPRPIAARVMPKPSTGTPLVAPAGAPVETSLGNVASSHDRLSTSTTASVAPGPTSALDPQPEQQYKDGFYHAAIKTAASPLNPAAFALAPPVATVPTSVATVSPITDGCYDLVRARAGVLPSWAVVRVNRTPLETAPSAPIQEARPAVQNPCRVEGLVAALPWSCGSTVASAVATVPCQAKSFGPAIFPSQAHCPGPIAPSAPGVVTQHTFVA